MKKKCDDSRFEYLYLEYQRRKQHTDEEVINDLTNYFDQKNDDIDDSVVIEPFEKKEDWDYPSDAPDIVRNRVEKVMIEPFSLDDELKNSKFDENGNFIPLEEKEEEDEEEDEEEEIEDIFDKKQAVNFLRLLITSMNNHENVCQVISRYKDDAEHFYQLTEAAFNLQFFGIQNIYDLKRKKIGKIYNQLLEEVQVEF